ncbi:hypothetical protein FA570_30385, partial [Pseudomonas aeruginosa]|nr:hypothetical protein [Pseudomonas aeruginosa]
TSRRQRQMCIRDRFGADTRVHALPIVDCQRRLTETLVCLREQRSRRIVETFLDLVGEDLPAPS